MKNEEFEKVVEGMIAHLRKVLLKKGNECTRDGDRLSNFKGMAAFLGCTPEKALIGVAAKHLISIRDLVDDIEKMKHQAYNKDDKIVFADNSYNYAPDLKLWDEKLGDGINYLILLRALIEERMKSTPKKQVFDSDIEHPVCNDHH